MKKEEILERARAERSDEMEQHFNDKSMLWIIAVLVVCCLVFASVRLANGQYIEDHLAAVNLAISAGGFYRFSKVRSYRHFFQGIAFGVGGVIFAVIFFCKFFGAR